MKKNIIIVLLSLISLIVYSQEDLTNSLKAQYENEEYDKIISDHSDNVNDYPAKAVYYVGMAYYMKADDNNCLKLMDLSIKKDNTDPNAFFIKGITYNYLWQFEDAIKEFEEAIKLNPNTSYYHSGIGDSYFNLKKMDKALDAYKIAIEKEDAIDRPFTMIPQIYASKNDSTNALIYFYIAKENISKKTNSYITILYNIGLFELLNKNYDKAEIALIELIKLDPTDFYSYSKIIQVYYGKKEYEKAEPYREQLYNAYNQGVLKDNLKEMFCFDQFYLNDKLIQVFEKFEEREGELYYKHLFYIVNKQGDIEYSIQTENSPISVELGGLKYAVGMNKGNTHYTFGFIKEDFEYDDLKSIVIEILNDEIKPSSSSSPAE